MKSQNKLVVKSNDIIQRARFSLSLQEHRLIDFLISLIRQNDEQFKEYEFDIQSFCKLFGIDYKNGKNRSNLKTALQTLSDKSMWVEIDGEETLVRWITKPKINAKTRKIKVSLDEDMMPFLLHLSRNFTAYEIGYTSRFTSSYSHPLYEFIKSIHYHELDPINYTISVGELKLRMGVLEGYDKFSNFRARALDPAIEDINKFSDKIVSYEPQYTKRAITHIRLHIETKDVDERVRLMSEAFDDDTLALLLEEPHVQTSDDEYVEI